MENKFKGKKVLLVEDNMINKKLTEIILKNLGFDVEHSSNGLEALEKLEKENFDLILMDIQMPKLDGYDTTKLIREREETHNLIIGLSANAMEEDIKKGLAIGMDEYIPKPVRTKDIEEVLKKFF